nr:11201_t:CDS:2 [Entrophospora candida]
MSRKILLLKEKNIQEKKTNNDNNDSNNDHNELDPYEEEFLKKSNNYACLFLPVLAHIQRAVEGLKVAWNEVFLESESSSSSLSKISGSWLKLPIFVVGKATEKSIKNLGFNNVFGAKESGSSELLANYIETYYAEHNDQIIQKKNNISASTSITTTATPLLLFLVGDKRRDELPKKLLEAKINFQELLIYETKPNPQFSIELNKIFKTSSHHNDDDWWIVFFSPSGVDADILKTLKKLKFTLCQQGRIQKVC